MHRVFPSAKVTIIMCSPNASEVAQTRIEPYLTTIMRPTAAFIKVNQ